MQTMIRMQKIRTLFISILLLLFSCQVMSNSVIAWTVALQAPLSFTIAWSLLKFVSIESVILTNHLILCHALLFLPSIIPSISIPSNEFALLIRQPMDWSFSFNISPSNEHLGLISFRIDWFELLVIQGTLRSLLQHHSLKASIPQCSAFFVVQLSHSYMTTGKTIIFTIRTFVSKVISLLFNTLYRFVIAFLPRSKCVNIMATVTICHDFGVQVNKLLSLFPSFSHLFVMKRWDWML